jgi:hypothetical protein
MESRIYRKRTRVITAVTSCGDRGLRVVTSRGAARLFRLVLVGILIAVVLATTATADSPRCTHGVSSVGPVVLKDGHLSGDTQPRTETCLR